MPVLLDTTIYPFSKNIEDMPSDFKTKGVAFGDGYRQSVLDGINYDQEKWRIEFIPLSDTKSLELKALLKNSVNGDANRLSLTLPGESTSKYWTAKQVRRVSVDQEWIVSCIIEREFPLVG